MSNRRSFAQTALASRVAAEIRSVFGRIKRRLREDGGQNDLTPSQISVLLRLEKDGPATVSNLARAECMRPQSMSAVVTSLQEAGLVRRARDPSDGRQTLMSLRRQWLKSLAEGRAARQDWLSAAVVEQLSAKEQKRLQAALELLARLVED